MRVLIINVCIGSGSAGTIVLDIYKSVIANGDTCMIAYSRGGIKNISKIDTIKIGNKIDTCIHALKSRLFGSTATYSKEATRNFLKRVDMFKPDIIHIHGLYGYYINMEMLFTYIREHNIKLVTTLHSCWDFTGHCCYFDYVKCEQWKDECRECPQKKSYPKSIFLENTKKNFEIKCTLYHSIPNVVLVSPSNWMDKLVSESCLGDLKHVVIHNGVDFEKFHKQVDTEYIKTLGIDNNNPTILSIASLWDKRKGLDDVKELALCANSKYINIVVVGLSDKQLRTLPNNIIGLKRTDNIEQLVSLYSYATVLFNPTYEDNYPTVNLEAIACGTPIVTYDTGGSKECLLNGHFGTVIKKKAYEELLSIVDRISSKELVFDFSDLSGISKHKMTSSYIKLYNQAS